MKDKKKLLAGGLLLGSLVATGLAVKNLNDKKHPQPTDATDVNDIESGMETSGGFVGAEPATPFEITAFLASLTPSLMTRDSVNQGAATAASVLSAKGVSNIVEYLTDGLLGKDKSYANRLFTRSILAGGGYALGKLPEKDDESLAVSSARSAGRLLETASIGGIVYDSVSRIGKKKGKRRKMLPATIGALVATGLLYRGRAMLEERQKAIDIVSEDPSNKILPATVAAVLVLQLVRLIGFGIKSTGKGLESWLGQGPLKKNVARIINTGFWTSLAVGAYWGGVTKIGTANEKMEAGYTEPPTNPNVSGSPESISNFIDIGLQGRRFVTNIVTPAQIEEVTGHKAKASPIRVYIGFNSDRHYHSARAEMAMVELRRTKAFSKKYLLLVSPTGTGWIDQTMIEAAEILSEGDIATCVVQYAKYPSFLALQKVVAGRRQFRQLLWAIKMHTSALPASKRPKLIIFGESLGAWSSSDTVMHPGMEGFDNYGIDKALWVGMPGLAKWGKIEYGKTALDITGGTVEVFDRPEQYEKLTQKQKDKLRAVILSHDNDPIARIRPKLLVKRPKWIGNGNLGRGVPSKMEWSPIVTFFQTAIDAANAMRGTPGEFRSHGHDYRADMAYFVNDAYQFGGSKSLVKKVVKFQIDQELLRTKIAKEAASSVQ